MDRIIAKLALTALFGSFVISGGMAGCDDEVTAPVPAGDGGGGRSSAGSSMGSGEGGANVLTSAQLGDPELRSAQTLAFGPGGVLLVGDGRSDRIVAIETGDTSSALRKENAFTRIDNITGMAAQAIGGDAVASELQINDIAVNPVSWRTYIAVSRATTNEAHILWVDVHGDVRVFDLDNVVHAVVHVPPAEGSTATIVGLSWTDQHVIASLTPPSFIDHEVVYVELPFEHESGARHATTRVFHRSFNQWITDQPLDRFFTFTHEGELLIVGSYTSSIVRFTSSALEDGSSEEPGETVFDILDGRTVLDFMPVQNEDELDVYVTISNLMFDGEPGALKLSSELFTQEDANNDEAPTILDFSGNPLMAGVERAPDLDGAVRFEVQGDDHAVVMKDNRLQTERLTPEE